MQATPYPEPRTSAGRPPCDPPRRTTFDSSPGDEDEPTYRLIADSVRNLMKHLRLANPADMPLMLKLVRERIALINEEIRLERLFAPDALPPTIRGMYDLRYLFEDQQPVRVYTPLLDTLFEAERMILRNLEDQNGEPPASEP